MKKTFLMLALVGVALAACDKKENEAYQFKGTEQIYLNGVNQPKFKSTTTQYTIEQIVRLDNLYMYGNLEGSVFYWSFGEDRRDTTNNRLLVASTDVLTDDGRLIYDFIGLTDVYLRMFPGDTVGYIPQSVINSAREQIEALYAQERYDEIYELFHTAFTFYTCTGQEYKDIVANGGN